MRKIKCIKIIHVKFRGAQKLIIFRYLFPWDTFFCFYTETNFLTKCTVIIHTFYGFTDSSQYPEAVPQRCLANMHQVYRWTPIVQLLFSSLWHYAKQKLFLRNYSISVIFAFQEDQKCIFKTSKKAKMQFFPSAPTVAVLAQSSCYMRNNELTLTINFSSFYLKTMLASLAEQCQMLRCQRPE